MLVSDPATAATATDAVTHLGLKTSEWIMIVAIIVGPILAVITQFIWQHKKQRRDAKIWVFSTLMSLRGAPLDTQFIRAANSIDVIFFKDAKVRARWRAVLAHLNSDAYKPANFTQQAFDRFRDLLAELLSDMAKHLDYEFDHTHFKEQAWVPTWHVVAEEENTKVRHSLLAALQNEGSLTVRIQMDPPAAPQPPQQNPPPALAPHEPPR